MQLHHVFAPLIAGSILLAGAPAVAQNAENASVDSAGVAGDEHSGRQGVAVSADGRHVAFSSDATNLVAGDTNGLRDIFVHDRTTGATVCLSVNLSGTPLGAYVTKFFGSVYEIAISSDGRYVAFQSWAPWLVSGDSNGRQDVFVADRDVDGNGVFDEAPASLSIVNRSSGGAQASDAHSGETGVALSGSGSIVCFDSEANNLVSGDTGYSDVFVRHVGAGATELASETWNGDEADGPSGSPALSSDGMHVAFTSLATNLVPTADTNVAADVFVRDRSTGTTVRVSVATDGSQANDDSFKPSISGDGRYVVFASAATNLVAGDVNLNSDVFLHDRDADGNGTFDETFAGARSTMSLSISPSGAASNGHERFPWISRDGRFVAFKTESDNLIPGDTNLVSDIVVHDRDRDEDGVFDEVDAIGARRLLTAAGVRPFDDVGAGVGARLSDDGRYVVAPSLARFDASDTNGWTDVVVTDVGFDGPAPAHYCTSSVNSHTISNGAMIGYQGSASVSENNLVLCATAAPHGQFGLFFYGPSQISVPLGNGRFCVGGSVTRLPVVMTGASGYATYALDLGATPHAASLTAGSSWNFQFWFRDPAGGGAAFNLSHGMAVTFE